MKGATTVVKGNILAMVALVGLGMGGPRAMGDTTNFSLSGTGVSAQGTITYTLQGDGSAKVTGITGSFTDTNTGINGKPSISNATITGLVPINPEVPLPTGVLAPDFSEFVIANGVPSPPASQAGTSLSYDNTFYPNGSPVVCTDYPFSGGFFDVYGLMFKLSNGDSVGVWSNGVQPGPPNPAMYGVAVADGTNLYDYVGNGLALVVPEPTTVGVLLLGAAGLGLTGRRKASR